ncbi:hypothetical protein BDW59DRAFT_135197 [Aspergillus cavernicola]|uniref:Uncharacterized protein n=1 Tax=Aspergillus cavernicola TaxID=176166 RepID=A0ABR4HNF2_9EURO
MSAIPPPHGLSKQPDNTPESLKKLQEEISQNLAAILQAVETGNSELATQLKTEHKELFQKAADEAKSLGLMTNPNIKKPEREVPKPVQNLREDLKTTAAAYNKSVEDGNHELAQELRTKLNELRKSVHDPSKTYSTLLGASNIWVEIHNQGWNYIRNSHKWDVPHGNWVGGPVSDYIAPYGVCYMQMTGDFFHGVNATTKWEWDGPNLGGLTAWWWVCSGDSGAGEENTGRSYHVWNGNILRFYFGSFTGTY